MWAGMVFPRQWHVWWILNGEKNPAPQDLGTGFQAERKAKTGVLRQKWVCCVQRMKRYGWHELSQEERGRRWDGDGPVQIMQGLAGCGAELGFMLSALWLWANYLMISVKRWVWGGGGGAVECSRMLSWASSNSGPGRDAINLQCEEKVR